MIILYQAASRNGNIRPSASNPQAKMRSRMSLIPSRVDQAGLGAMLVTMFEAIEIAAAA